MDWAAAMVFAEEMMDNIVLRSPPDSQPSSNRTTSSTGQSSYDDVCPIRKVRSGLTRRIDCSNGID